MRINEWKAGDVISENDGKFLLTALEQRYFHRQVQKKGVGNVPLVNPEFYVDMEDCYTGSGEYMLSEKIANALNDNDIYKPKPSILSVIGGLFK